MAWTDIPDADVDVESSIDTDLITALNGNTEHVKSNETATYLALTSAQMAAYYPLIGFIQGKTIRDNTHHGRSYRLTSNSSGGSNSGTGWLTVGSFPLFLPAHLADDFALSLRCECTVTEAGTGNEGRFRIGVAGVLNGPTQTITVNSGASFITQNLDLTVETSTTPDSYITVNLDVNNDDATGDSTLTWDGASANNTFSRGT